MTNQYAASMTGTQNVLYPSTTLPTGRQFQHRNAFHTFKTPDPNVIGWELFVADLSDGIGPMHGGLEHLGGAASSTLDHRFSGSLMLPSLTVNQSPGADLGDAILSHINIFNTFALAYGATANKALWIETDDSDPTLVARTYSPGSNISGLYPIVIGRDAREWSDPDSLRPCGHAYGRRHDAHEHKSRLGRNPDAAQHPHLRESEHLHLAAYRRYWRCSYVSDSQYPQRRLRSWELCYRRRAIPCLVAVTGLESEHRTTENYFNSEPDCKHKLGRNRPSIHRYSATDLERCKMAGWLCPYSAAWRSGIPCYLLLGWPDV